MVQYLKNSTTQIHRQTHTDTLKRRALLWAATLSCGPCLVCSSCQWWILAGTCAVTARSEQADAQTPYATATDII